jgi:hypothetical protein
VFPQTERLNTQFRGEFFNAFNQLEGGSKLPRASGNGFT